jgi:hypothetical protein
MLNVGMVCLLVALQLPSPDAAGPGSKDGQRGDLHSRFETLELESPRPQTPALVPVEDQWEAAPAAMEVSWLGSEFPRLSLQSSLQQPAQPLHATRGDDGGWVAAGAAGGALFGLPVGGVVTADHAAPGVAAGVALTSMVVGGLGGYLLGNLARDGNLFARICVITLDVAVSASLIAILPLTLGQPGSRNVGQRVGV